MCTQLKTKSRLVDTSEFRLVKFGGSSIASPQRFRKIVDLISTNQPVFIVLSALYGTTDKLVQLIEFIKNEDQNSGVALLINLKVEYVNFLSNLYTSENSIQKAKAIVDRTFDVLEDCLNEKYKIKLEKKIIAQGEYLSTHFLQIFLEEEGLDVTLLQAKDFVYVDKFGLPDYRTIEENLHSKIVNNPSSKVYITQGFLCTNSRGELDNLNRGGSDYTATILAAVLKVKEVEIWTDIDGVHNNDPRYVAQTYPLRSLSYDEASHLAYFGAKILHPLCVEPVKKANIPIRLKNTLSPNKEGTLIHNTVEGIGIKAISAKDNLQIIKVSSRRNIAHYDFYKEVFKVLKKHKISSDLITTTEGTLSLAIDSKCQTAQLKTELDFLGAVELEKNLSAVCIVGDFLEESKGFGKKIFESLRDISLRMISYGGTRHHLVFLINSEHKQRALLSLNDNIFKS